MGYKLIDATEVRDGTSFIIDGEPCTATKVDISKSGKHGASKVRIEAVGIVDGKKRIVAKPGSARFEVPLIEKKRGQVLSVTNGQANVMDAETFESFDIAIPEELKDKVAPEATVEYWVVETSKIIKRVL